MNAPVNHTLARAPGGRAPFIAIASGALATLLAVAVGWTAFSPPEFTSRQIIKQLSAPNGDTSQIEAKARFILEQQPYNATLLSALALLHDHAGQHDQAAAEMAAAARVSWRDLGSNAWYLDRAISNHDYNAAVRKADLLLRIKPDLDAALFPVLARLAVDPAASRTIALSMTHNPSWRPTFMEALNRIADPSVTFVLITDLQGTAAPATSDEIARYVSRLSTLKQYDQALLATFLFLPPDRLSAFKTLFNGQFEQVSGITPFDWQIEPIAGASLMMEPSVTRPSNRALHVFYDGAAIGQLIHQTILLPAGRYSFSVEVNAATPDMSDRLKWVIQCIDGPVAGTIIPKAGPTWTRLNTEFDIPENCPAQVLALQTISADRRAAVEVWYDSLAIDKVDAE